MPAPAEYAGTPTTRIVRSVVGGGRRTGARRSAEPPLRRRSRSGVRARGVAAAPPTAQRPRHRRPRQPRARTPHLRGRTGPHVFVMRKDTLSVGRGGSSAWVDVQIVASSKVSREHLRLRARSERPVLHPGRQPVGHARSTAQPIPPAVKSAEGVAQPGPEQPLPAKARIGLADALVIEFEAIGRADELALLARLRLPRRAVSALGVAGLPRAGRSTVSDAATATSGALHAAFRSDPGRVRTQQRGRAARRRRARRSSASSTASAARPPASSRRPSPATSSCSGWRGRSARPPERVREAIAIANNEIFRRAGTSHDSPA